MKVALGIPTYGHLSFEAFNIALIEALQSPQLPEIVTCLRISDSLVSRARNNIAHAFLNRTDADKLLFLDADIIFRIEHLRRLFDADKKIVCGSYALKKKGEPSWVAAGIENEPPGPATGLQKVRESGTGCMMIDREVFVRMIQEFPEIEYYDKERTKAGEGASHHDFFSVGVVEKRHLSEDWYFCHRARLLGYDVFLDTKVVLHHIGLIEYPLHPDYLK